MDDTGICRRVCFGGSGNASVLDAEFHIYGRGGTGKIFPACSGSRRAGSPHKENHGIGERRHICHAMDGNTAFICCDCGIQKYTVVSRGCSLYGGKNEA